ncbi:sugar ABC transporter ATP-binding protein [Mesorhizobium sp. CN5-321]|jgi:ribose transport system ATP-binding protein|uniref:sugar ABC transporter ATP-binding protein n=1 Tax=Mesorhizobium hunchu TaxID=3157708 RepID=UPI0032B730AB
MADRYVELKSVSKAYGGVPALTDVDFRCEPGRVHAILGENGAGKSTLMKLLAGVIQPDTGTISLAGETVHLSSPREAAERGTVCMFQELSLMPHLSVGDNIVLSAPRTRFGLMRRSVYREAREALDLVGARSIPLGARVSGLSLSERQLVEIAKAVFRKPRLLILDEATSALTSDLVDTVFDVLRMLKEQGVAILFISHRMHEVDAIADRISVFRNGRHIETFDVGERTTDEIVSLMIGRSLEELFPPRRPPVPETAPIVLDVSDVSWQNQLADVSVAARAGEIVGLGGLDAQGQQQIMHAVFGVLRGVSGRITLNGRQLNGLKPPRVKQADIGLALVPEDRKTEGLIPGMSVAQNMRLAALGRAPFGLLDLNGHNEARLHQLIERLALTYGSLDDPVATLSGGNQQKVVLAKWLVLSPKCLLLMDPTRGIDLPTKAQIYRLLADLAAEGMAVILQSTDYEELIHLCDRVYVFYRGKVARELKGEHLSADALIAASMNVHLHAEAQP